jgi:hypothetical protein
MTSSQPKSNSYIRTILSSRTGIVVILLGFLVLVTLISLPYGIDYGIRGWLVSQGASYARIGDIDFNPFSGKLLVKDLQTGKGKTPHLHIGEASLTVDWKPMFKSRLHFDEVSIKNSVLSIERQADGQWVIAGLKPAKLSGKRPGNDLAGFGVQALTILNSQINYRADDLDLTASITQATAGPLASWQPSFATPLQVSGQLLDGQVNFSGKVMPFGDDASLDGKLQVAALPLALFNALLEARAYSVEGTADTDARIRLGLYQDGRDAAARMEPDAEGNVTLHDFRVSGADKQHVLWSSKTISFQGVQVKHHKAPGTSTELTPADSTGHVSIQSVKIEDITARLHRSTEGRWLVIQDVLQPPDSGPVERYDKLTFDIGEITIDGNNTIDIQDEVVTPVFKSKLAVDMLRVARIDSRRPEQASELQVAGKIDEYADFSIAGDIQLFARQLNLDMQGNINSLDMPPISPYTQYYLGYIINSGHMDADLQAQVTNDDIDAKYLLKAGNPQVTIVDQTKSQPLAKALNMPLESALNLLRDKNKDIELEISMTGNIHDPDLDYSDAINQAIGKAVRTAALGYLKFTLGPFGALITLGQIAGEAASHISLEPIKFAAGQVVFDAIDLDYLERLAGLLDKRPELRIRICGTAVASDLAALRKSRPGDIGDDTLQLLAKTRADAVKDHLVSQYGVTPERLFICLPEVMPQSDIPPQVKLML